MPTVTTSDGVHIAVHDLGGHGRPLLLDHATGLHGWVWAPLAARLAGHYHSVAFDHRGHGDSERPRPDRLGWDCLARDTAAVVAGRPPSEGLLGMGHSMGAACLLLAEARCPGTFGALALFEPIVMPPGFVRPENPLSEVTRRRRREFASYDQARENYAAKPPFSQVRADALEAYVRHGLRLTAFGGVSLKCRPSDEARVYEGALEHRGWDALAEIACPVLVMRGRLDDEGPGRVAADIVGRLPRGRLLALDQLGHFGPLEDPDAVADAAADFFAAVGS